MRIVYVGDLWKGGTALHRARALSDLGHDVDLVDTTPREGLLARGARAVLRRLRIVPDFCGANRAVVDYVNSSGYDILWIDKGLSIRPSTLRQVRDSRPDITIVSYHPDDVRNSWARSRSYESSVNLYDIHITNREVNRGDLEEMGAKEILVMTKAFAPRVHRPVSLNDTDRKRYGCAIGFVGGYEEARARYLRHLSESRLPVAVWGPNWPRRLSKFPNLDLRGRAVWEDEYAKAISGAKISLGFLRQANRDRHTSRSLEIPACGGFMLAERTDEHLSLFREGEEAEFFSSVEELESKCRYYLRHPEEREAIARAGRKRCQESGYSNQERLREILRRILATSQERVRM